MTHETPTTGPRARADRPVRPRRPTAPDGLVLVDKPAGWTSHDVVARTRGLAGTRKVGHAGTLDPMATGVLVLGVGRATRLLTYVVGTDKEYTATIRLGQATTTDDAEGEMLTTPGAAGVAADAVAAGIARLTGEIQQVPSSVSAIKVDGKRAYALVRSGADVALDARTVTISRFDVHAVREVEVTVEGDSEAGTATTTTTVLDVDVTVVCSSGTYIRALARDLGADLGVGGHLTALRRTRVGGYTLDAARSFEELESQADADGTLATLPLADAARGTFPVRVLTAEEVVALSYGQWLEPTGASGTTAALSPEDELVALVEDVTRSGHVKAKPVIVFAPSQAST
ncbi:tRNA pseudouridine synthase B [Sanguibacter keddieii DSM 10542]|uniref:tRNA pseudouridine synthase B n=1 Tax=Sanguibacter keddieii (strain ATCC 51767 / DSM 10542 / NCFB 3025 / ST-74) TaxID=446469 RepID=D1BJ64_SANKS|nr:tRNA pseudouridine(55) synthase TruB [Sanguibacter keddieii]ACZ22258.1 tRNA pseudouridine synthase B [Sanguibacter keddieii DSM 10542]